MALHGYNRASLKRHDKNETFQENKHVKKKPQPNLKKYTKKKKEHQNKQYSYVEGHWVLREDGTEEKG